jgi:ATP-dependent Clp protease ATP-binding subunit ClpB
VEVKGGIMWLFSPSSLDEAARQRLLCMEQELGQRVRGQDLALETVSKAVRKSVAGLKDPNRPFAAFVFLGPNRASWGELARALAWFVFGDAEAVLLFEMSEYHNADALARFVGSADGHEGEFSRAIQRSPCSVVVFNDIEKAGRPLWDLFFRIRDEGAIVDGRGNRLDFRTCVLVATSSLGSQWISPHCDPRNAAEWRRCWDLVRREIERELPNEFLYRAEFVLFQAEQQPEADWGGHTGVPRSAGSTGRPSSLG